MHEYVEKGDEKLLRLMYALAKEYTEDELFEYDFSDEDLKIFNERSKKRLSGESKTYNWIKYSASHTPYIFSRRYSANSFCACFNNCACSQFYFGCWYSLRTLPCLRKIIGGKF